MAESNKSRYYPSYPKKYKGNPNNIICRSSWERKFCRYCDLNEQVLEWGSEEFYIPYISPVDNRVSYSALSKWLLINLDLLTSSLVTPLIAEEITTTLFFFFL